MRRKVINKMLEIEYIDPDGESCVLVTHKMYLQNHPELAAKEIAEYEISISGSDLLDPNYWPREYKVLSEDGWQTVLVSMEYEPVFYTDEKKEANKKKD